MRISSFITRVQRFVESLFFPLLIGLFSFMCWLIPMQYSFPFLVLYALFCILPLFCPNGKGYFPLFFFLIIVSNQDIHFKGGISPVFIIGLSFATISLITYIIVHKPKFSSGSIFFSLLGLYCVFLLSFFVASLNNASVGRTGILYLIGFFTLLMFHALMNSVLGQEESLQYFSMTYGLFAVYAALEVFFVLLKDSSFSLAGSNFSLGWSYTRETVSSFLTLSLPFFCNLIHEKKPFWLLPMAFVFVALLFLSTDSGLLSIILFVIPLVILTLKDYSKYSPFFIMFVLLLIGSVFGILFAVNMDFNQRIFTAVQRLNFFSDFSKNFYSPYLEKFLSNLPLGSSIISLVNENGTLSLANSSILSTAVMGGILGLASYLVFKFFLYWNFIQKQLEGKSFYLIFLLNIELIGLVDNTLYNLAILTIFLLATSAFLQSNKPDDVLIHDDYFRNKDLPRIDPTARF